jgi:mRNA interferase HigB
MNIYNKSTLKKFADKHADSRQELEAWYNDVTASRWSKPSDVTRDYSDARAVSNNRIIFKIRVNDYRLIVEMNYSKGWAFIVFLDTHEKYLKINAETVSQFRPKKSTKQMRK